jgi:hypothetical protein
LEHPDLNSALYNLNSYSQLDSSSTQQNTNDCSNLSDDVWTINKENCPPGYTYTLIGTATISSTTKNCLVIGDATLASVLAKYAATSWAACSKLSSLNNALTSFHNWVDEKNTICDSLVTKLNTIYDSLL